MTPATEELRGDMAYILKVYNRKGGYKKCVKLLVKLLLRAFDCMDYDYHNKYNNKGYDDSQITSDELADAYTKEYIKSKADLKVIS